MADTTDTATSRRPRWRRARYVACAAAVVAIAGLVPVGSSAPSAGAATGGRTGIICNRNAANGQSNFLVTATDGYVTVPDGNSVYMWGYAYSNGGFQLPGPTLCVTEGERVNITLVNGLPVPTSVQIPGIEGVTADGFSAGPAFDGTTGQLQSLASPVGPGGSITYSFTADHAGTFLYESGTDPQLQVQMGLFGTLVVYPSSGGPAEAGAAYVYDSVTAGANQGDPAVHTGVEMSKFSVAHEYGLMLSEIDPDLHVAVEQAAGHVFTSVQYTAPYHARYFMINGRSFPDTIAPNNAPWLPTQPYSALSEVQPYGPGNPLPALLRYVSVGTATYPFHPHSNHERVIATDAHVLADGAADLSLEKFGIVVNPGQTQDATFTWTNVEDYETSGVPVAEPNELNLTTGDFWNGTPYLGQQAPLNPGINQQTECGEYFHVAHSHDLTQATNYGASFGGMLTLIRVDPADDSACG